MEEPVNCIMHFGNYVWVGLYRSLYVFHCKKVEQISRFDVNTAHDIIPSNGKIWVACNDKIRIWDAKVCFFFVFAFFLFSLFVFSRLCNLILN